MLFRSVSQSRYWGHYHNVHMPQRIKLTTTSYTCDVCHRSVKVPTNNQGISTTSGCNITMGCRGKLLPISNASEARKAPGIPPDVPNVSNWLSRKILQTHNQSVISSKWVFQYQLSGTPALHVYIYKDDGSLEETTAFTYTLSQQKLTVTLGIPSRGIVQCVTPSPATTYSKVS